MGSVCGPEHVTGQGLGSWGGMGLLREEGGGPRRAG